MKMLPRLQAEERLAAIDVALLAAGGFAQHDADRLMDGLRRQASGEEQPRPQKADQRQLAGMGIGVKIVASTKAPSDG